MAVQEGGTAMMGMGQMMLGMGWYWAVLVVLALVLVALLVFVLVRQDRQWLTAEGVLKQRLARGEISREEFE
jgi:uncharacterized membrane protein